MMTKSKLIIIISKIIFIFDLLLVPITFLTSHVLKFYRNHINFFPFSRRVMQRVGVMPVTDHYYDPLFNFKENRNYIVKPRNLPGIDFNFEEQLLLIKNFYYSDELLQIPLNKPENNLIRYYYNNSAFGSGDAEFLYSIIRYIKPRKIIEIGSGFSTILMLKAIQKNTEKDPNYLCEITAIEPFENRWLSELDIKLVRAKVETIKPSFFDCLDENDILFIDSSHMIKREGDILFEYLEIFSSLNSGVLIHVHDIFTPYDYPLKWIKEGSRFWNEQYLLEAILSHSNRFQIIGSLNYLSKKFPEEFNTMAPVFKKQQYRNPGSFWMRKAK